MFTIETAADGSPFLEVADRPGLLVPEVAVRPLRHGEAGPVEEVFAGLSAYSRQMRFLAGVPVLTDSMQQLLTDVDHDRHGCWVVTVAGEPVALGRYVRLEDPPHVAEIALEVVDRYQARGLGRLLRDVVAAAAADAGITSFYWMMDAANDPVRNLAVPLGGAFLVEDGVLEGTTPLPAVDPIDAARVARVARAARRGTAVRTAA